MRFHSRTIPPSPGTSFCGTRTSASRRASRTTIARKRAFQSNVRRHHGFGRVRSPAEVPRRLGRLQGQQVRRSVRERNQTSRTSISDSTSCGPTSTGTPTSLNACSRLAYAGSGEHADNPSDVGAGGVGRAPPRQRRVLHCHRPLADSIQLQSTGGRRRSFLLGIFHQRLVPGKRSRDCDGPGSWRTASTRNVFYSDNLRAAAEPESSGVAFVVPWWYRTEFTVVEDGQHTLLRIKGVIPSARCSG